MFNGKYYTNIIEKSKMYMNPSKTTVISTLKLSHVYSLFIYLISLTILRTLIALTPLEVVIST